MWYLTSQAPQGLTLFSSDQTLNKLANTGGRRLRPQAGHEKKCSDEQPYCIAV